jgi:hypothetical protein
LRSSRHQTPAEPQLKINLLAGKIKTSWLQFYYSLAMEIANVSFEMLWHLADEVLKTVREIPGGVSEQAMVREFESRGISPAMFYGILAELENAGLVRWRGNWLYPALNN